MKMTVQHTLTALFLMAFCLLTAASSFAEEALLTNAKQAIIVDYDTGNVMFEKNADEKMPTSSMSKVLTTYLVFEALQKGKIKLDDTFVVSEKAWKTQGSKMFVPINDNIKIEDLLKGVIIQSGNDATIVLAEGLAGSEESFAAAMNRKAEELGMKNSHFMNASGLPDPEHYSTARDLSILAKSMVKNYPEYYKIYSEKEFTYNKIKQGNRNPLLYKNIGADGIKTGHTEEAGYGLIGTGVRDGRRVILVLNGLSSMKEREAESVRLLQWGLTGFKNIKIFDDTRPLETAPVVLGERHEVDLVAGDSITVTMPNLHDENIFKVDVVYKSPLVAPIKKGDVVGKVLVEMKGDPDKKEIPLLAADDVKEMGYFLRMIMKARMLTTGQAK